MSKTKKDYDGVQCLELALMGEQLCNSRKFEQGITHFKAALECGTNDLRVLSAIFSHLGNAYFYEQDYTKALKYHELDLKLSREVGDLVGESKACGNLGNTFKMLERYDEAIHYCAKHLEIALLLKDQVCESRALYNLGNVYHTIGKSMSINSNRNSIEIRAAINDKLRKAVEYYKLNLELMRVTGDRPAQGRACGNIGNTYYLLGEFEKAIEAHQERLQIARECCDREAERRAYCNLGNSLIFCGEFEKSIENYKQSLFISQEIGNRQLEAQAYFSIANTYFLLKDYKSAIEFYLKHLEFAQLLDDKLGQSKACWSLGNAYNELGDTEGALRFASHHLLLAKETNDKASEEIANKSVIDLKRKLEESAHKIATAEHNLKVKDGINYFQKKDQPFSSISVNAGQEKRENRKPISNSTSELIGVVNESEFFNKNKRNITTAQLYSTPHQQANGDVGLPLKVLTSRKVKSTVITNRLSVASGDRPNTVLSNYQTPVRSDRKRFQSRKSMENMEIMKLTPTTIANEKQSSIDQIDTNQQNLHPKLSSSVQTTHKLVTSYCSQEHKQQNKSEQHSNISILSFRDQEDNDQFLDLLASFQSKRMDDQRCSLSHLIDNKENRLPDRTLSKTRRTSLNRSISSAYGGISQTSFVASGVEQQNTRDMRRGNSNPSFSQDSTNSTITSVSAATQECRDELFDLIEGIQSRRMEEQRAPLPPLRRSQTTQETHLPKTTSTSSNVSSIDNQSDRMRLHRMHTEVEINNDHVKHNRQMSFSADIMPDDDFFDQLMRCQASRLDSQRTALPSFAEAANNNNNEAVINQNLINNPLPTVDDQIISNASQSRNDDEFLNLLMRFQAGRIEEQRSNLQRDEGQNLINLNSSASSNVESNKSASEK